MFRWVGYLAIAVTATIGTGQAANAQQGRISVPTGELSSANVKTVDLAQAGRAAVNIEIVTACVGGTATFKIVNVGEAWPRLGKLRLFQIRGDKVRPIAEREMRFARGQRASFRLKAPGDDALAVFVEPSWYERDFAFDAKITCQ